MRPPSRVRLCSVFKEPVPSSGGFPVSRDPFPMSSAFFFVASGEAARKGACLVLVGFCSLERSGPGTAGGGKIRKPAGDVKRFSSRNAKFFSGGGEDQAAFTQGMGPDEGDPKRRGRRLGIELPPLRQGRKAPYPSKGQGVTAAALPGPSGCPEGRRFHPAPAIPRKWDSPPCARNPKPATPRLRPGR